MNGSNAPPSPLGPTAEVRLVAGLARREVGRRPGAWIATVLTGVLFAGLLILVGTVTNRLQDRAEVRSFKVAIGGDLEGGRQLADRLGADERIDLVDDDDPEAAVTDQIASAGVVLPPGVDAAVAAGEPIEIDLSYRTGNPVSFEAVTTVLMALQEAEVEVLTAGIDVGAPNLVLEVEGVADDARVGRVQLARQVGAVAALLCLGLVTAVAGVLGAARDRRALEPLLLLPLARRSLPAGVALGALPLASLQVLAGVALLVATAAVPASTWHQPPDVLVSMLVAGALAALPLALIGCAVGSLAGSIGTGTDDAVSLGDLLAVPFVVVGIVLFAGQGLAGGAGLAAIPVLGQALLVREAVAGTASAAEVAAAVVSALVTATAVVVLAGRVVGDERRLLRSTR